MTGLLVAAVLLSFGGPGPAVAALSAGAGATSHEHGPNVAPLDAAVIDHDHCTPCDDGPAQDACCGPAQCNAMHSGLPTVTTHIAAGPPHIPSISLTLATPDGLGIDPALPPPRRPV